MNRQSAPSTKPHADYIFCVKKTAPPCAAGKYNPVGGHCESLESCKTCIPCPAGKAQKATGTQKCDDCEKGTYCKPGSSTASACAAGYFCPTPDSQLPCKSDGAYCPQGRTKQQTQTEGRCLAGSACADATSIARCQSGEYCPEGTSKPRPCAVGSWCSIDTRIQSACLPGEYCPAGSTRPTLCAAGKFSRDPTVTGKLKGCPPCPEGKYQDETGRSKCSQCSVGTYCEEGSVSETPCVKGRFSSDPTVPCADCAAGTYQAVEAQSECTLCPSGCVCPEGQAACAQGVQ